MAYRVNPAKPVFLITIIINTPQYVIGLLD